MRKLHIGLFGYSRSMGECGSPQGYKFLCGMLFHRPSTADIRPECRQSPRRLSRLSWSGKIKQLIIFSLVCLLLLSGCDTNVQLTTEAGIDAIKAVTLSDKDVHELAARGASFADGKNRIAPPESSYAKRLRRLVGDHIQEGGYNFNYKVYLSPEVNAFAMADGTIRIHNRPRDGACGEKAYPQEDYDGLCRKRPAQGYCFPGKPGR